MAVTTRDVVAQALGGRRFDIRGYLFEGMLLLALLVALGILVTLLTDVLVRAMPVLAERLRHHVPRRDGHQ